jgi:hypothetical protein
MPTMLTERLIIFIVSFLSTLTSFPIGYKSYRTENKWIMTGIKIWCKRKRNLHIIHRNTNNLHKKYCAILWRLITEANKLQIKTSSNMVKTGWKIIKDTTGKTQSFDPITKINSADGQITDTKEVANAVDKFLYRQLKI